MYNIYVHGVYSTFGTTIAQPKVYLILLIITLFLGIFSTMVGAIGTCQESDIQLGQDRARYNVLMSYEV